MHMYGLSPEEQSAAIRNVFGPIFGGAGATGAGPAATMQAPPPAPAPPISQGASRYGFTPEQQSSAVRSLFGPALGATAASSGPASTAHLAPPTPVLQLRPQSAGPTLPPTQYSPQFPVQQPTAPGASLDYSIRRLEEVTNRLDRIVGQMYPTSQQPQGHLPAPTRTEQTTLAYVIEQPREKYDEYLSSQEYRDDIKQILLKAVAASKKKSVRQDLMSTLQALESNPSGVRVIRSGQ